MTQSRYFLLLWILIILTSACSVLYDNGIQKYPVDLSDYVDRGDYEINPRTILLDLNQGKLDVFKPILTTPVAFNSPYPSGSFPWRQPDYLSVANTLHQFVWKENLDNWYLYGMLFARGCQDNPVGFDGADITFFKESNSQEGYTTHEIEIHPLSGGVSWGGGGTFPRPLLGWTNIDLDKLEVTADDALQRAEENGGREARLEVDNVCDIHILLKPNGDDANWHITYFPLNGNPPIFKMFINPYTGKYKILKSNY